MFSLENLTENDVQKICIKNTSNGECVKIVPEFCGLINELILNKNNMLFSILDGYKSREEFEQNPYFKGAILLPFPNRLRNGEYSFNGKKLSFPINDDLFNTAIHGFFYNRGMSIKGKVISSESAIVILSNSYVNEYDYFPFTFDTNVTYSLSVSDGFACKTEVINHGDIPMPIGIGWHPYFSINNIADDLFLKIPRGRYNKLDNQMIPTGETFRENKFISSEKINGYNFNTGLKLEEQAKAYTEIYSSEKNLGINFWQESGEGKYSYLQLYIPPQRNSIAVEPMSCNVDAFNNGEGLVILEPGEVFSASFGVTIS